MLHGRDRESVDETSAPDPRAGKTPCVRHTSTVPSEPQHGKAQRRDRPAGSNEHVVQHPRPYQADQVATRTDNGYAVLLRGTSGPTGA